MSNKLNFRGQNFNTEISNDISVWPPVPLKQEIFDKVADHLLNQMKKSIFDDECVYRGPDGLQCAVGCLITDENYSRNLEGADCNDVEVVEAVNKSQNWTLDEETTSFLRDLQVIHDQTMPEHWNHELRSFAASRGLKRSR